ncbi:winged helix-turn-helix domain-containing protein [Paenibacillus sp. KQZ6P-2]|uniref:Winged helix-turn-helix domain-containing protein n=1 Tax=Paenibacillus mangrovi TaxID=2931978 RepID=A0A9X2B2F0_9BACL|nr:winged helix-turn-helix domain-containing protein [Paenibacillus mangrovi]MCJ8012449.1 winged helix-turn-helix domain-containing protein [Paenibacillus mangrovi]
MDYTIDLQFEPIHEFMNSLHSYICRKSHKKIDLAPSWAQETKEKLTPEFAKTLDGMLINGDWTLAYLLAFLVPKGLGVDGFLTWFEQLSIHDLIELFAANGNKFPQYELEVFQKSMLSLFHQWNEQYYKNVDPAILNALQLEKKERLQRLTEIQGEAFVDETTNGMLFKPFPGFKELWLVPQYHFQPLNIVSQYGDKIICHYNSCIYLGDEDVIPTHDLRLLRSLGEKNRLKILRFLHQGPRTFTEIVSHLKLSKGITHDHISKLRSAGALYAHFEGENLTEYSLRKNALYKLQNRLIHYIEEGG